MIGLLSLAALYQGLIGVIVGGVITRQVHSLPDGSSMAVGGALGTTGVIVAMPGAYWLVTVMTRQFPLMSEAGVFAVGAATLVVAIVVFFAVAMFGYPSPWRSNASADVVAG